MSEAMGRKQPPAATAEPAVRPSWLKSRKRPDSESGASADQRPEAEPSAAATGRPAAPPNLPATDVPGLSAVEAVKSSREWPRTLSGLCALLWQMLVDWWTGLYLGWGVTTSLLLHVAVAIVLAFTYFASQFDQPGMLVNGKFEEFRDGEEFENVLDSRLDTSFGDKAASLEFVASDAVSDVTSMLSPENMLGGAEGDGDQAGEGAASMSVNINVPKSAITRGSFTVWTEPEHPTPRVPYDIIIQVKLPNAPRLYRLSDLSGTVRGSDGYLKQIKYPATDKKGVKDGLVQVSVRIPGAAQLVRDVIQVRSKLLKEEQTIEIIFGDPSQDSL